MPQEADHLTQRSGLHFDRSGVPISLVGWSTEFERNHVCSSQLGDVLVSTIYLGTDHSFRRGGPVLIYETMVFGKDEEWCDRYPNVEAARAGHADVVARVVAGTLRGDVGSL